jgi:hypothetical protein
MSAPALPVPSTRRSLRVPAAAIALVTALAAAVAIATPHHAPAPRPAAKPVPTDAMIAGATLQQARCSNWLRATPAERSAGVAALAAVVGAPNEYKGVHGTALTTAQGFQLLDNVCSSQIARNFLLYELYIRASAFRSLATSSSP